MATQPLPNDEDEHRTATLSHVPADAGGPVEALVSGTVGDRCVACGSPLSSDQRYCVVCGERRGAPRFSLPATAVVEETVISSTPPTKPPRSARSGSGTTLVAGVATLLLAVLVGVLIGHGSASNSAKTVAGPTKIIKINSGAAAPATPTSTGSTVASGSSAGSASKGSSSKGAGSKGGSKKGGASSTGGAAKKPPVVSKKAAAAQQQAASKVLGGTNNAPPTVTVGQKAAKGTPGVNKKTGKFDGSFFGG